MIFRNDGIVNAALSTRLSEMTEDERIAITGCIRELTKIRNVGTYGAIQILWALGRALQQVSPQQIANDFQPKREVR